VLEIEQPDALAAEVPLHIATSRRGRRAARAAGPAEAATAVTVTDDSSVENRPSEAEIELAKAVTAAIQIVVATDPVPLTRREARAAAAAAASREPAAGADETGAADAEATADGDADASESDVIVPAAAESTSTDLVPLLVATDLVPADSLDADADTDARPSDDDRARAEAEAAEAAAALAADAAAAAALVEGRPSSPVAPRPRRSSRDVAARRPAARAAVRPGDRSSRSRSRRNWAKAGLSAVAMAFVVGMTAVTAIPTTVSASPVDSNLVNLSLNANARAETQQLITAGGTSSEVVDRDGYAVTDAGELQAAGYSTAQLLVGRSLAQELVNAMDAGKLVGSVPDHMKEIRWIAQGVTMPDCGVDYRVLEIIAIAVRNFDQVGVSDINRKCTGQIEGAGTSSSHYIDGGGHAVDFYLLDNKSLNGSDAGTLKLISILDPVMPVGARVGQAGCRASAGVTVNLTNWTEFDDSCTHMHVDVPVTDAPLLLADSTLLSQ
jgi:hypothetical protein